MRRPGPKERLRREHVRIECAVFLRLAACIAIRSPDFRVSVISMHARLLSRAIYRGSVLRAHVPVMGDLLNQANRERQFSLSQTLGHALWIAYDALGHPVMKDYDAKLGEMIEYRSDLPPPPKPARPRRRPMGEVHNFQDLKFEVRHAEHQMDRAIHKGNSDAARNWHERLLHLTKVGRDLSVTSHVDAADLLDDVWRRAKPYCSAAGRRLRVQCRDLGIRLRTLSVQSGMTLELAQVFELAQQLDHEADGEFHRDISKVVAWLNSRERLLPDFQSSTRNQYKPAGYGPLERAEDDKKQRIELLETATLGGQKVTRQRLYDMVWIDPVTIVAARFGISDVALRKLCQRRSIPLPERGYWSHIRRKTKDGRHFRKAPLPSLE